MECQSRTGKLFHQRLSDAMNYGGTTGERLTLEIIEIIDFEIFFKHDSPTLYRDGDGHCVRDPNNSRIMSSIPKNLAAIRSAIMSILSTLATFTTLAAFLQYWGLQSMQITKQPWTSIPTLIWWSVRSVWSSRKNTVFPTTIILDTLAMIISCTIGFWGRIIGTLKGLQR
jgi:hypothetical protein